MVRGWHVKVAVAFGVAVPSLAVRLSGVYVDPLPSVLLFGAGVVASAFLLAWAAEAAEADVSASLAVAVLAFIAVLPEYAVDLYFAYASGSRPEFAQYAAANMTGSNRLLLGLGWPLMTLVFVVATRRRGGNASGICLEPRRRVELGFLAVAGAYAFLIPMTRRLSLLDAAVLLTLFALYIRTVARQPRSEPEFAGVAADLAALPRNRRRLAVSGLFVAAAAVILSAAQPFAEGLVATGERFGIDEFLLVQWLAPLASEAPEFIVAALWAARLKGDAAMGTLLSSKVNQWTLLVGTLPLAHALGGGGLTLSLDGRQAEEFLLTAAQTVLGLAILMNLEFNLKEAGMLFGLFAVQFFFPQTEVRLGFAALYLVVAAVLVWRGRDHVRQILAGIRPSRSRSR
jgi:cation:H+ antiporter